MFTVTILKPQQTLTLTYTEAVPASRVLEDAGITHPHPCGGRGVCGKCRIRLNGNDVLACRTMIEKDSTIDYTSNLPGLQGITEGFFASFEKNPLMDAGYGAAIDIGTTTIAGYVYKFPSCERVHSACIPNPQSAFGADVISRIEHFGKGAGAQLAAAVRESLRSLTEGYPVEKCVITGNTAMLHLLTERDPSSMAVAPYHAEHLFGEWIDNTYLMPCISAYVGADVTAAMLASGIMEDECAILLDIGTNGEMVLKHGDTLLCCATAAGPCFEGAGISCGTPAVPGAISKVFIENGEAAFSCVDNKPPVGLCGTGLVDSIAVLLELGLLDETGYLEDDFRFGDSDVVLSPEDVRQFQLAKSAIRSGLDTLLHHAGISCSEVEKLYIAGGFGSFLNIDSAVRVGLIPPELSDKAIAIGNGAGSGASMVLQSKECLADARCLAERASAVTLTENPYFAQRYMENMMFPESL
ncbi:MAG: DUF4445 domain-containing protein [Ruminococcaceae bacterium]|nr:DUF4445 domain-containing protein [Oscillospiraceae bacterium]